MYKYMYKNLISQIFTNFSCKMGGNGLCIGKVRDFYPAFQSAVIKIKDN